ncbi:MAG: hypothetical protein GY729_04155 [Desulfobacteraceae bacterium]|nr:hypothetical protein [Desulfobacteraceae bacterium]
MFAILYMFIPGAVDGLEFYSDYPWLRFMRLCCFSIVTMTTLGFGDITAVVEPFKDPGMGLFPVIAGHFLITLQVINGYVILGALVTRLAILFNSDGPAHPFEEEKEAQQKKKEFFSKIIRPSKYVFITLPTKHPILFFIFYLVFMISFICWKYND